MAHGHRGNFGFRISDLPSPSLNPLSEPPVGVALLRRASSRGMRDVVIWRSLATGRLRRIAGRSRGPQRQRRGRRSRHADLGGNRTGPRPAELQRSGDSAIATSLGLWVRFSDWSDGGTARVSHQLSSRGQRGAVPSGVYDQEARLEPPVPSADGAREARSRREEESMPEHRRRRATKRSAAIPIGPKGFGGMAPSSSLPLVGDGATSPSSRRQ